MTDIRNWEDAKDISDEILKLRTMGRYDDAIALSKDARVKFPSSYVFPKITGDLLFQSGDYEGATEYFLYYLQTIPSNIKHPEFVVSDFAKRYYRLRRIRSQEEISQFAREILMIIQDGKLHEVVAQNCLDIITPDLPKDIELSKAGEKLVSLISDDVNFASAVTICKRLESENPVEIELILDSNVLKRNRTAKTRRIDAYAITSYERIQKHEKALQIAVELMTHPIDGVLVRSILRICRKLQNYQRFDDVLSKYPEILKSSDFNILYELVYYFEAKNDFIQVQNALTRIENSSNQWSVPILQTLRNFYGRFGLFDGVERVTEKISELKTKKGSKKITKFDEEVRESEEKVWSKIKELSSQLEYQTQLGAISELTTGISHELGQPITNIRYTIQFYQKQFEKNIEKQTVLNVFNSILQETERLGGLVKRLSPITSSRSVVERYDIVDRVRQRVRAEQTRLQKYHINVSIKPQSSIFFVSDPVRFDQLVSNLLLNSVDAIDEKKGHGSRDIRISIFEKESEIMMIFEDTGKGITAKDRGKVFTPFFTTKAPGKGEGLGLFIVWNILKMQGGKIYLDPDYSDGARFVITIPKKGDEK